MPQRRAFSLVLLTSLGGAVLAACGGGSGSIRRHDRHRRSRRHDSRPGGSADPGFRWLYPYDGTVFPRALRAPELQLAGAAADATYVKISFGNFLYEGFFGASAPVRAALSQSVWKGLTESAPGTDKVKVEVTKLSGGQASGPVAETWTIAPASFKGVVYYNTYLSKLTNTGAVVRVRPNQDAEAFIGGCTVCHSVSANGNMDSAGPPA